MLLLIWTDTLCVLLDFGGFLAFRFCAATMDRGDREPRWLTGAGRQWGRRGDGGREEQWREERAIVGGRGANRRLYKAMVVDPRVLSTSTLELDPARSSAGQSRLQ